jgi:hypothetical protein
MSLPTNTDEATASASYWIWVLAAVAGAFAALSVTWIGDGIGVLLESVFPINLRSWEFAAIQVSLVNTPAGAVAGLMGAVSKRWLRGLAIGVVLHAVVFLILLVTSDSFLAAPASVNCWVLATGITGGALAGVIGGWCGQAKAGSRSR